MDNSISFTESVLNCQLQCFGFTQSLLCFCVFFSCLLGGCLFTTHLTA